MQQEELCDILTTFKNWQKNMCDLKYFSRGEEQSKEIKKISMELAFSQEFDDAIIILENMTQQ